MQASELVRIVAAHLTEDDDVPMAALPAAVPYFLVRLTAICVERRDLGVLREFVLRAVQIGICRVHDIAAFLGVREEDIRVEIDDLVADYFVIEQGALGSIALMEKGIRAISMNGLTRALVRDTGCYVNAVTRKVELSPGELVQRRNLPSNMLVLPAIPARPPRVEELDVGDIKAVFSSVKNQSSRVLEVTRLGQVLRSNSLFFPAQLLLRRGVHSVPLVCVNGTADTKLARDVGAHPALQAAKLALEIHELSVRKILSKHAPSMRTAQFAPSSTVRTMLTQFVRYSDADATQVSDAKKAFLLATDQLLRLPHWLTVTEAQVMFARAILHAEKTLSIVAPPSSLVLFEFEALQSLSAVIKRGVKVEIHIQSTDMRFFGPNGLLSSALKGADVVDMLTSTGWCGFCCDKGFAVVGLAVTKNSTLGRCDSFFGALVLENQNPEQLLHDLTVRSGAPVVHKRKKRVVVPGAE